MSSGNVQCTKCGYKWWANSEGDNVDCPSCHGTYQAHSVPEIQGTECKMCGKNLGGNSICSECKELYSLYAGLAMCGDMATDSPKSYFDTADKMMEERKKRLFPHLDR